MNQKTTLLLLCLGFTTCLSHTTLAKTLASGPFPLQGGVIEPYKELFIPLDSLPYTMRYLITCDIVNPAYTKQYPIVLKLTAPDGQGSFTVNGKLINHGQVALTKFSNHFEMDGFWMDGTHTKPHITFRSYDDTDTATVENCIATFSTT